MSKLIQEANEKVKNINKQTAMKLHNQIKNAFNDKHSYNIVLPEELKNMNMEFHITSQKNFETLGYRYLADIEDAYLKNESGNRSIERIMKSSDSRIYVTIHDATPKGFISKLFSKKNLKTILLYSEFQDGRYVITASTSDALKFSRPTIIDIIKKPCEASIESLISEHEKRLDGHSIVSIYSVNDVIDSKLRYHRCLYLFRKNLGFNMTEDEKVRFKISKEVADELDKLASTSLGEKLL